MRAAAGLPPTGTGRPRPAGASAGAGQSVALTRRTRDVTSVAAGVSHQRLGEPAGPLIKNI